MAYKFESKKSRLVRELVGILDLDDAAVIERIMKIIEDEIREFGTETTERDSEE